MAFFAISKMFWGVFAPSHLILWASIAAAICLLTRYQRTGRYLAVIAAVLFVIIGVLPTNIWLLHTIEDKYTRGDLPEHVDGILTLGGGLDYRIRLVGTYALAVRYPSARIVFSGGSWALINNTSFSEAKNAKQVLLELGLRPDRLTIEDQSRNTWENILFTQRLIKPRPGETWVLATSALQLPRAMEIANRLNWKFLPWPTDNRSRVSGYYGYFEIPENLWGFDNAIREWIGLLAYRANGMATELPKSPH
jgi:uncharacterized SAM-binding protein YcdF (DUF218 family)